MSLKAKKYISNVLKGLRIAKHSEDNEYINEIKKAKENIIVLLDELMTLDEISANKHHINDIERMKKSIEFRFKLIANRIKEIKMTSDPSDNEQSHP